MLPRCAIKIRTLLTFVKRQPAAMPDAGEVRREGKRGAVSGSSMPTEDLNRRGFVHVDFGEYDQALSPKPGAMRPKS